jgi:hypothetical protein
VEAWVALVITTVGAGGGTALGALIGLRGSREISREERAEAARAETLRAFTGYVSAAAVTVGELRDLPPVPKPAPLDELVNRFRGPAATYIATRRHEQQITGGRNRELAARLSVAYLDLWLRPLPRYVRAAIVAANDYIERLSAQRSEQIIAEWRGIHARLMVANTELRSLPADAHLVRSGAFLRGFPHSSHTRCRTTCGRGTGSDLKPQ